MTQNPKTLELNDPEAPMLLAATIHQLQESTRPSARVTPLPPYLRELISGLQKSRADNMPFVVRDRLSALRLQNAVNNYRHALRWVGKEPHLALRMISRDMGRLPYPTQNQLCSLRSKLHNYALEVKE